MPSLTSPPVIDGRPSCPPSPVLNIGPLPGRPAAHRPTRLGEADIASAPLVHGVARDPEPLGDLDDTDGFIHAAHRTQSLDTSPLCLHYADTTRSGPGAAPTARGPATTEEAVMTNIDPTRPQRGCAPPDRGDLDDLIGGGDPYDCPACLAAGGKCEFHRGWAAGWDACAAFVARRVHEHGDAGGAW